MPSYRALRSFPFGKNRLKVGDVIETKETLGDFYIKAGLVEAAEAASPAPTPTPKPVPAGVEATEAPKEPEPTKKKPVRHQARAEYERRDMRAKEPVTGRTGKAKA
jgi:hypothetical protein